MAEFETVLIRTWDDFQAARSRMSAPDQGWLFRAQATDEPRLVPSLERALLRFALPLEDMPRIETRMLCEFQRRYHLYSNSPPERNDIVEWLSLMRHYGAPTRLLDWTYSIYVALFFAVEQAHPGQRPAIWAVDQRRCRETMAAAFPEAAGQTDPGNRDPAMLAAILASGKQIVVPLNAFRLNERLTVQQGTFLAPANLTRPFMECFETTFAGEASVVRMTIDCTRELLVDALAELQRMNITQVSLFPGLDGFARSLENHIALPHFWS